MIGYLDSSVLLRHILNGDSAITRVLACERIISSELLEIECRRVIHRLRMDAALDDEDFVVACRRLNDLLSGVSLLSLSSAVKKRAMEAFPVHVKTLDALHLASALVFADAQAQSRAEIIVFSFDAVMNRCALALGFPAAFDNE